MLKYKQNLPEDRNSCQKLIRNVRPEIVDTEKSNQEHCMVK